MNPKLYWDHAATSFPKSPDVIAAVSNFLQNHAGNAGRGAYPLAISAAKLAMQTRQAAAQFFGHNNPERVLFQPSTTQALNLALFGVLKAGDHAITTSVEHNAVARPLRKLEANGVNVTWVPASPTGTVDPAKLAAARQTNTKVAVITAGSNLLGCRTDLAAVRAALGPSIYLAVDAAQVAGTLPLDFQALGLDLLAVPGHKAMGGPAGIALLLVSERVELLPLIEGGTGSNSELPLTPALFPDGFEAGTSNGPGIAGLAAALEDLQKQNLQERFAQKMAVWQQLRTALSRIDGIELFGCANPQHALPVVSFRARQLPVADLAYRLAQRFGIAVRAGLHCAPDAHRTVGTLDSGLVRASIGPLHQIQDADFFAEAVRACLTL